MSTAVRLRASPNVVHDGRTGAVWRISGRGYLR